MDKCAGTDMLAALKIAEHIHSPCNPNATGGASRAFYIEQAKRMLPTFRNPFAREFLEKFVAEYTHRY